MNALFNLQSTAGQRTHEVLYEATWIWSGQEFPCTHGDITKNPMLIMGGYSPDTQVWITVRMALFGDGPMPVKDQLCFLSSVVAGGVLALKVSTIETSVGDL